MNIDTKQDNNQLQDNFALLWVMLAISMATTLGGLLLGKALELHLLFTGAAVLLIAGLIFYSLIRDRDTLRDTLLFFTVSFLAGLTVSIPLNSPYVSVTHRDLALHGITALLSMNIAASLAMAACAPRPGKADARRPAFYATPAAVFIAGALLHMAGIVASPFPVVALGIMSVIAVACAYAALDGYTPDQSKIGQLALMYIFALGVQLCIFLFLFRPHSAWRFWS